MFVYDKSGSTDVSLWSTRKSNYHITCIENGLDELHE